jgi:hypothetical protein
VSGPLDVMPLDGWLDLSVAKAGIEPRQFSIRGDTAAGAGHAASRPRDGLQARKGDLFTAHAANAVLSGLHASQRKIDFTQCAQLAFDIRDSQARGGIPQGHTDFIVRLLINDHLLPSLLDSAIEFIALGQKEIAQ